jgi:hypothetical protein
LARVAQPASDTDHKALEGPLPSVSVSQKKPVAADKRANGTRLSPLNSHSRRVAFVRGRSGLRGQTLLATTSLVCAAPNIGTPKAGVKAAARTGRPRRHPLWWFGFFSVVLCSIHRADCRRGAHAVGSQQAPNDTALSALTPLAFMVTKLDFECRIDYAGGRRNADGIVDATNQSVWRVLRIVVCFGLRVPAEYAERNYGRCTCPLSQS